MKKTYTITGGTGYIGSKLIEYLADDSNNIIFVIMRKTSLPKVLSTNVNYVVYDGSEQSLEIPLSRSDYLVHLGALYTTQNDEESTIDLINSNIIFSTQLFNVAQRCNPDLVIASASTFSALDEHGNYAPKTLYAATKRAVEDIAHYYKNLSIHFLTFPDTFGPDDWRNKVHNLLARNKDWPFAFRSPSSQEISLMHIEDVIGNILSVLMYEDKGVHIYDIYADGIILTLKELSEIITNKPCTFDETAEKVNIPKQARAFSKDTGCISKYDSFFLE